MRFGVHVRIAGGLTSALQRACELGCEAVQLFSGNPNAWQRKPLDRDAAAAFASGAAESGIYPIIIHTPYLVNLASPDETIWRKSKYALADALARAPHLGASIVVTHIGSHKGSGVEAGIAHICKAVRFALRRTEGITIALELGSGAGNSIGSRFEEIARIMECMPDVESRVGVCIDTAHLWAAGCDVSTKTAVRETFTELDRLLGFHRLKVVHLNDTRDNRGSHRDRHWHIGKGRIGRRGFRAVVNYPGTGEIPGIIETPFGSDDVDLNNLETLRALRA